MQVLHERDETFRAQILEEFLNVAENVHGVEHQPQHQGGEHQRYPQRHGQQETNLHD